MYFTIIVTLLSPPLRWLRSAGHHGYCPRWPDCHCFSPSSAAGSPGLGGCGWHCRADHDGHDGVRGTHQLCCLFWPVLQALIQDQGSSVSGVLQIKSTL